jgi:hypothetical protein
MGEVTPEVSNDLVEMETKNGEIRKVYPEIAEFFASRKTAEMEWRLYGVEYDKKVNDAVYEKQIVAIAAGQSFDTYEVREEVQRALHEERRTAETKYNDMISSRRARRNNPAGNPNSWEILSKSPRKEVAWIVDNCMDNESYALTILKYLPATIDELWVIAKDDNNMCGVFDQYFERALAAGVIKDADISGALREWSALGNYIRRNFGGHAFADVRQRLRPIIKAEVAYALEKAKAEWQGYDEARAENVRRNRSEGAKKAAETRRRNQELTAHVARRSGVESTPAEQENEALASEENDTVVIPQISTQSAMTGEYFRSDIQPVLTVGS